jgi:EAL domain-containing protein (putative c-di-GMP-specific phosphodiesterase class I)
MLLAHDLKIGLIAEGVETTNQMGQIKSLGYEYGQGYLFSKPVNCDRAGALLKNTVTSYAL